MQIPLRWRSLTGGAFKNSLGGSHSAVVGHVAMRGGCSKTKCYIELCSHCRVPCLSRFIACCAPLIMEAYFYIKTNVECRLRLKISVLFCADVQVIIIM